MAEKDTPSLGGFDMLSDMLTGSEPTELNDGRKANVNEPSIIDPDVVKASLDTETGDGIDDKKDIDDTDDKASGDDSNVSTTDDDDSSSGSDDKSDPDSADKAIDSDAPSKNMGEYEADITSFLNERFSEEFGWKLEEEDAPKTIEEFTNFMKELVETASAPKYASDDVKRFDEFAKNGGNLRDFYRETAEGRVDTGNVDIDNSFDQKIILKEHLGNQKYTDERINKMVKRYEDAGVLEEEASDALELLKEYNSKQEQKLLENQENNARAAEEQQQKFVLAVEDSIKNLDSIQGVRLSDTDRKELGEAILTVDSDGYTPYQRKYMSDVKNLIESAFFTMKGDVLVKKSKQQGSSDAVKKLHDKLTANKGNKGSRSGGQTPGNASSGLSVLGSMLQGS